MDRSKFLKTLVAGALASIAGSAVAGDITLFENPDFQGRSIAIGGEAPNLDRSPLNRSATSVVVAAGTWEMCSDAYFRGHCEQFTPGSYRLLGSQFAAGIESVRQVAYDAPRVVDTRPAGTPIVINPGQAPVVINAGTVASNGTIVTAPTVVAGPVVAASVITTPPATVPGETRIVLYEENARGSQALELTSDSYDLERQRFDNRANAALVVGGVWRLCEGHRGHAPCMDFPPGRYDSLGSLNYKVSSAYVVAPETQRLSTTVIGTPLGRMVLYQYPNYGGASASVERGSAPDFAWTHFGDRPGSFRVDSGRWLVCSDPGYQGQCRVLGPGTYPYSVGLFGGGINSARQVWEPQYGFVAPNQTDLNRLENQR